MTWRAEQKLNRVIANIHAFAQYMPAQTFDVLDTKEIIALEWAGPVPVALLHVHVFVIAALEAKSSQ